MAKKKYYKRSYRKKFSFKRAISNYHYTKLTYVDTISWDTNGIKFVSANGQRNFLYECLNSAPDWSTYKNLFVSYKVVALRVEVRPLTPQGNFATIQPIYFAYAANTDMVDYKHIAESNKSVMLSPYSNSKAFWRFNNGLTGWENSGSPSQTGGSIFVAAGSQTPAAGGIVWSLRVDLYVMFKNTV